jgi:hypothetical protein
LQYTGTDKQTQVLCALDEVDSPESIPEERKVNGDTRIYDGSCIFGFESDLERNLGCIPMAVRLKLDQCAIKLSLDQWRQLPLADRRDLLQMRCEKEGETANFRRVLEELVKATTGDEIRSLDPAPSRPWDDSDVPVQVARQICELGAVPPTGYQWRALTPLQRFALIKLSRDGDHHRNLIPALREFNLYT